MFLDQDQINIRKNELNTYNIQRTSTPWNNFEPNTILTLKDVKSKKLNIILFYRDILLVLIG